MGLWLQQGAAEFADRGMAVVHDAVGNVYVTGQFSDTLQFDVVHINAMYSAVFLVCFDPPGNEMWFRAFGGRSSILEEDRGVMEDTFSSRADFVSRLGAVGHTHTKPLGENSFLHGVVSLSRNGSSTDH